MPYSTHPIRNWFITQFVDRPKTTFFVSLALSILMISGVRHMVIDDNINNLIPSTMPSRIAWEELQEEFGSTEVIFVAFGHEGKSIFTKESFAGLWDLAHALEETPEVEKVFCITKSTRMDNKEGFLEVSDLQSSRDLNQDEIDRIQTYLDENQHLRKRFVNDDRDYFLLVAQPYDDSDIPAFARSVENTSRTILKGFDVHFGGFSYITGIIPGMMRSDTIRLLTLGIILMLGILYLNFRHPLTVFIIFITTILSLASMIGFMGWAFYFTQSKRFFFTMANTSMPIILLTIANSSIEHVITKFYREMRAGSNPKQALITSMDALLIPIFLTNVTTFVGFISMVTSPLETLQGYGITVGFGVIWAWFLSSLFFPSLLLLIKWNVKLKSITKPSLFENIVDRFGKGILKRPRTVFFAGIFITVLGIVGLFLTTVDVNFINFFRPGTSIRNELDFMERKSSGTLDVRVSVEGEIKEPQTLKQIENVQNFIASHEKIKSTISIADVVKEMHCTVMDNDPAYKTIPDTREKVDNLFTLYRMSGDEDDFSSMINYKHTRAQISGFGRSMPTSKILKFDEDVKKYIREINDGNTSMEITGSIIMTKDLVYLIIRSTFTSIFASLIINAIIAAIFFRNKWWGFLSMIPLSVATILSFGLMGYFGIEITHVTAILSSIIIGVGADFSVHYIAQFRRLSSVVPENRITEEVMDEVGYPIVLDALTNMSFGMLIFSSFIPVQYIGGLMVFGMISTSVATLTLFAASAELLKHKLIERK